MNSSEAAEPRSIKPSETSVPWPDEQALHERHPHRASCRDELLKHSRAAQHQTGRRQPHRAKRNKPCTDATRTASGTGMSSPDLAEPRATKSGRAGGSGQTERALREAPPAVCEMPGELLGDDRHARSAPAPGTSAPPGAVHSQEPLSGECSRASEVPKNSSPRARGAQQPG